MDIAINSVLALSTDTMLALNLDLVTIQESYTYPLLSLLIFTLVLFTTVSPKLNQYLFRVD